MRREASNSLSTLSLLKPASLRPFAGCCNVRTTVDRYVNKIRELKGARYGYTYSTHDIGVSPRKILFHFFHPSVTPSGYRRRYVKNRSRSLRAFIIYRPCRLFALGPETKFLDHFRRTRDCTGIVFPRVGPAENPFEFSPRSMLRPPK